VAKNCEDIRTFISAQLDGEITVRERNLVLEHLVSCQQCREFLNEVEEARGLLRSLLFPHTTESLDLRLLESLRATQTRQVRWWKRGLTVPLPVAAAVVLALLTALLWALAPGRSRNFAPATEETAVRTVVIQPQDVSMFTPSAM